MLEGVFYNPHDRITCHNENPNFNHYRPLDEVDMAEHNAGEYIKFFVLFLFITITLCNQIFYLNKRFDYIFFSEDCPWCEGQRMDELIYVPVNTFTATLITPADHDFMGDLIWLRTSYYFGSHALTDRKYFYLVFLLDLVTDLSPKWKAPYIFGAVILPIETDSASETLYLLEKGLQHNPFSWQLYFFKGYILWKYMDEPKTASQCFFESSRIKGAPPFLISLSATLATEAGEKELARRFLEISLKNLDDPIQRSLLIKKVQEISK